VIRTKLTEMLHIQYPIVQAGMGLVADVNLTAAVSEAGGLGILGSYTRAPDELRNDIREVRARTDRPFGVNLVTGDPLEKEYSRIVMEERIPVISHGRGNPAWLIEASREHGLISIPTVGTLAHALRAQQDGADAIVIQGAEAGGHTGTVGSIVLLPLVASRVSVPVIAGGGFCDGKGLAAALALGAEGIYMGTMFSLTRESPLHQSVKELYLEASEEDTAVTTLLTGKPCRFIRNEMLQAALAQAEAQRNRPSTEPQTGASYGDLAKIARAGDRFRASLLEGDRSAGGMPGGQVVGRIDHIPSCQELIERTMNEAEEAIGRLASQTRWS